MKHGLGLNKILGTIHTYPTLAEANKYAAGLSRVRDYSLSPLTPPYVRFRIRRFKWNAGGAGGQPPARRVPAS
jgi:hypothetical protein